eukprot:6608681-Alexandrium_andersonii.AAC.1
MLLQAVSILPVARPSRAAERRQEPDLARKRPEVHERVRTCPKIRRAISVNVEALVFGQCRPLGVARPRYRQYRQGLKQHYEAWRCASGAAPTSSTSCLRRWSRRSTGARGPRASSACSPCAWHAGAGQWARVMFRLSVPV